MIKNEYIIKAIISLAKGYQMYGDPSLKYILGQTIRQYGIDADKVHYSLSFIDTWNYLTSQSYVNYWYDEMLLCDKADGSRVFELYKGSAKTFFKQECPNSQTKIRFNNIFHVDHIVPVKIILEQITQLSDVNEMSVKQILDKMHLCKMLKIEDHCLGRTAKRTDNYKDVVNSLYRDNNVILFR